MVSNSHSLSPNVLQNFVLVVVCAVLVRTSLEAVLLYAGQQGKCLVWKEGELSLHLFHHLTSCFALPDNFHLSFLFEENSGLHIHSYLFSQLSTAEKYICA